LKKLSTKNFYILAAQIVFHTKKNNFFQFPQICAVFLQFALLNTKTKTECLVIGAGSNL
jgi:hypothetical protein